jgi:hypothetical protein
VSSTGRRVRVKERRQARRRGALRRERRGVLLRQRSPRRWSLRKVRSSQYTTPTLL